MCNHADYQYQYRSTQYINTLWQRRSTNLHSYCVLNESLDARTEDNHNSSAGLNWRSRGTFKRSGYKLTKISADYDSCEHVQLLLKAALILVYLCPVHSVINHVIASLTSPWIHCTQSASELLTQFDASTRGNPITPAAVEVTTTDSHCLHSVRQHPVQLSSHDFCCNSQVSSPDDCYVSTDFPVYTIYSVKRGTSFEVSVIKWSWSVNIDSVALAYKRVRTETMLDKL